MIFLVFAGTGAGRDVQLAIILAGQLATVWADSTCLSEEVRFKTTVDVMLYGFKS